MSKLIAIIDDEDEMEYIYALMLEEPIKKKLIEIKFFSDARVFFDWFIHNKPDLILSDINMPHVSGTELGRRIREFGHTIPTFFISGYEEEDYVETMKELGGCKFFSKPLDLNHLVSMIEVELKINFT